MVCHSLKWLPTVWEITQVTEIKQIFGKKVEKKSSEKMKKDANLKLIISCKIFF